jgi:hypothetical protein
LLCELFSHCLLPASSMPQGLEPLKRDRDAQPAVS